MSLLKQPLMRLVSGGAVLLILLGTVLIPFDDLADPRRPWGSAALAKASLACFFFFILIYHRRSHHLDRVTALPGLWEWF